MRVLLINSPSLQQPVIRDMAGGLGFKGSLGMFLPPLELAGMAATLLQKGFEVTLIDADAEGLRQEEIIKQIEGFKPDAIVATVSLPSLYRDCSFLRQIRNKFENKIIAKTGISYPPILGEILLSSSADLCLFGEAELAIDKIISGEEKRGCACLVNGDLRVEDNLLVDDLDCLPFAARGLLPNDKYSYVLLGDRATSLQTSRGCPFPCAYYCPYPLVQGQKWRAQSPERVVQEIEDIVYNHGINKILFRDATFTLDQNRTSQICDLILEKKIKLNWWCETRVDCLNIELMQKMRQAGCRGMNIGVETGSEKLLRTQAKTGLTLERLKFIQEKAQENHLHLHFLLMIGLPDETKGTLYETYKLIRDFHPPSLGITIITPYPGTKLYQEAKDKGWLETEDWSKFDGHQPVMHTDHLSKQDLLTAAHFLNLSAYLSGKDTFMSRLRGRLLEFNFKRWIGK